MKQYKLLLLFFVLVALHSSGQKIDGVKYFTKGTMAGEVQLLSSYYGSDGKISYKVFTILTERTASYELKIVSALQQDAQLEISIDNSLTDVTIQAVKNGWQKLSAGKNNRVQKLDLTAGKHEIRLSSEGDVIPMVDDISLESTDGMSSFDMKWEEVNRKIEKGSLQKIQISTNKKGIDAEPDLILSNPEGIYDHEVDVSFTYTTFTLLQLTAGNVETFATINSTADPVLQLFLIAGIDNYSWANDDANGQESSITVNVPVTGLYGLVVRPYIQSSPGTTTIKRNGTVMISNTPLGGKKFYNTPRNGDLNFFTCRLSSGSDTRIFAFLNQDGPFKGYNDDYSGSGSWSWGLSSRIKKNFSASVNRTLISAYSLLKEGSCDVYMGNPNSEVNKNNNSEFPDLWPDDAIKTAVSTGQYNCTSWAGGVTSAFIWPPQWSSTYNCSGDGSNVDCFDNFYSNNPVARYPGAWSYTRWDVTPDEAVIDLWKNGSYYTHASVTKPGNSHPHGYDWESKPGSLARTFHPRNALEGPGYGSRAISYKFTGNYANSPNGIPYATDADAVKAGVAVYEHAELSVKAQTKLKKLIDSVDKYHVLFFDKLYEAWQKTWKANSMYSDPEAYCRNKEFKDLSDHCHANKDLIYIVFDKYVKGDIFIGKILWEMTKEKYSKLLEEVKQEIIHNPYDKAGRFKVHGDHDNGVRYVEKILAALDEVPVTDPGKIDFSITVSPNPVKTNFTIQVITEKNAGISVDIIALNNNKNKIIQSESEFAAGKHSFNADISNMAVSSGEIIAVRVRVNNQQQVVKVLVIR